jgi:hypothetical protein
VKKILLVLCMVLTSPATLMSQSVILEAKGGMSSSGTVGIGNFGGGGGGDNSWDSGPIIGLGVRLRKTERVALEAVFEYSSHKRLQQEWQNPLVNDPRLTRLELSALARWSWSLFRPTYFMLFLGPVLTYQKIDQIVTQGNSMQFTTPGTNNLHLGLVFGLGLGGQVADRWELWVDAGLRVRSYAAGTIQLGVAYAL